MKLLSDELLAKLEAQDPYGPKGPGRELTKEEEQVVCKFFTPDANWTWYAVSASRDPETGNVQFFGLVDGLELELGYFWLSELQSLFVANSVCRWSAIFTGNRNRSSH